MRLYNLIFAASLALWFALPPAALAKEGAIRVGIVGCDTSHVIAFTTLINDSKASGPLAKVQVTAAYPGGSDDISGNRDAVNTYVAQLRYKGIAIVATPGELIEQCDAILLESVDGRVHLDQFRAIAKGKPVFVDKPAAASLADVLAIYRLADMTNTPVFSSSALRFCSAVQTLAKDESKGKIFSCETTSPMPMENHHPDLFWYGIHGVESLFTIMGSGCETVGRTDSEMSSLVVGKWRDGRIGSYRGVKKGSADYTFDIYAANGIARRTGFSGYEPLVQKICEFFVSHKPPVRREDTIDIFAFMEAADESKRLGGAPVKIAEMIQRAEQSATPGKSAATQLDHAN
jgi:hypothetical protein